MTDLTKLKQEAEVLRAVISEGIMKFREETGFIPIVDVKAIWDRLEACGPEHIVYFEVDVKAAL